MKKHQDSNPYESAGIFSQLFFCWLNSLFKKGWKKDLENEDLYKNPKDFTSQYLGELLQKEWDNELKKKNPSLLRCLFRLFGLEYISRCPIAIIQECFVLIIQAYFIGEVIQYFDDKSEKNTLYAYICAAGIYGLQLLFILLIHTFLFFSSKLDTKIRVACSSILYRKALRLSHSSLGKSNIGQMVNLLSNDINKFDSFTYLCIYIIAGPLQVIISVILLWQHLGCAILVGVSAICLYISFQIKVGKILSRLRLKIAKLADKRLYLINELLTGMRMIKMYTWENIFATAVEKARKEEIKTIKKSLLINGIPLIMGIIFSKLIMVFSFLTFVLTGGKLTANILFVTVALSLNIYRSMFFAFPQAICETAEALVSIRRLQNFLLLQEKDSGTNVEDVTTPVNKCEISMENVQASWNKEAKPTLEEITLKGRPEDLIGVIGSVGSGKTSLLMTILGEIPHVTGAIRIKGKIAYVPQEAWVFGGTIRENILFGAAYHEKKYKQVLFLSALEKDVSLFPDGDLTLVGERGMIMSGGQKARINLARALYLDADIYLLDDPLSAVDTSVANHIFEKCIMEHLREKIRILVTHQIHFLKSANKIIMLKEGKCEAAEDFYQLTKLGPQSGILPETEETDQEHNLNLNHILLPEKENCSSIAIDQIYDTRNSSINDSKGKVINNNNENVNKEKTQKTPDQLIKMWKCYINIGNGWFLQIFLLILLIIFQSLLNGSDYWLLKWTMRKSTVLNEENILGNYGMETAINITTNSSSKGISEEFKMYIYLGLIGGLILTSLLAATIYFIMCMNSSVTLHNKMLRCIIRTPISFLDTTPLGNLMNRFSKDIGTIDAQLPICSLFALTMFLNIVGMYVVNILISAYLIIPSTLLAVSIYFFWNFYFKTAKHLKRLEGLNRSPIFSHLSNTLNGLSTIRAFKVERNLEDSFDAYQDQHTSTWFLLVASRRWFAMNVHMLTVINLAFTIIILFLISSFITGAEMGLCVCYAIIMTMIFLLFAEFLSDQKYQMASVERVMEYSQLPSEANCISIPEKTPSKNWPQKGNIEYVDVCLQYSKDESPILKNLNFSIKSEEKIGIVGRTGAGKSSIIAALLRMTEPTGTITIDGINTRDIGLHDLRNKISVIPQDPLLFSGSLRRNIDPLNQHDDNTLWEVLDQAHLKDTIKELSGGLDTELAERGSNFSVGQRQLICLARAILYKNKIIVFDEATSNIDKQTDLLIQKTIRERFRSCTILTVAHRLQTIMDADRIMVLEKGKIEEFDEPYDLLKNKDGIFYNMVRITGSAMMKYLLDIAKNTYCSNNSIDDKNTEENKKDRGMHFANSTFNSITLPEEIQNENHSENTSNCQELISL